MRRMQRPECPTWLQENHAKWTEAYCKRRASNPSAEFVWPQYQNAKINHELQQILGASTQEHCAYCDGGFPLGCASRATIDHFKPKEAFCSEAFAWANLYLACDCCQQQKSNNYDERLLRPDAANFSFAAYFQFNYQTGEIEPNLAADAEMQTQAQVSIDLFGLNHSPRPKARLSHLKSFSCLSTEEKREQLNDWNYRFILEFELEPTNANSP